MTNSRLTSARAARAALETSSTRHIELQEATAGTHEVEIDLAPGTFLYDVIVVGGVLWTAAVSAALTVEDSDSAFTDLDGLNLKSGGDVAAGAAVAAAEPRFYPSGDTLTITVAKSGAGTAGRTHVFIRSGVVQGAYLNTETVIC